MVDFIIFIDWIFIYPIYIVWCYAAFIAKIIGIQRFTKIAAELRPFVVPSIVFHIVAHILEGRYMEQWGWFLAIMDALMFLIWHFYKDVGDDDRWKKRRRKVAEKVKSLSNGRLVVVPNHG